jgi:hypothetical protein
MAPILELIKKNAVPVNVMRSASKGSLPLPADEMLEVLVYLTQNPLFGQDARMTLAQWDTESAKEVLGKDTAAAEVLIYYCMEENRRPSLMPTLIENHAIPETLLMEIAGSATREIVTILLASPRARENPGIVEALLENIYVTPVEARELRGEPPIAEDSAPLQQSAPQPEEVQQQQVQTEPTYEGTPQQESQEPAQESLPQTEDTFEEFEVTPEAVAALEVFQKENAAEIAETKDKPFELTKEEEPAASAKPLASAENAETPTAEVAPESATVAPADATAELDEGEQKRVTILQKIGRLNVGKRIQLGFVGGKEDRAILIRDTARLVQNAVLNSPKVTDAEIESFAGSKSLQENVFREIARQRRFLKLYPVIRNLTGNPKCPLDISLTLVKSLMVQDLKALRHNKNVPETIRKVAAKLYLEKASRGGAKKE